MSNYPTQHLVWEMNTCKCLTYAHAEDLHAFGAGMPQLHGLSNEGVKAQHQVLILCSSS